MFSQGFVPVENPALLEQIRKVFPRVKLIAMREKPVSPTFLASVEVASQNTIFTGDDSLELAFQHRNESLGTEIGVGVRLTTYSQMDESMIATIQSALRKGRRNTPPALSQFPSC